MLDDVDTENCPRSRGCGEGRDSAYGGTLKWSCTVGQNLKSHRNKYLIHLLQPFKHQNKIHHLDTLRAVSSQWPFHPFTKTSNLPSPMNFSCARSVPGLALTLNREQGRQGLRPHRSLYYDHPDRCSIRSLKLSPKAWDHRKYQLGMSRYLTHGTKVELSSEMEKIIGRTRL